MIIRFEEMHRDEVEHTAGWAYQEGRGLQAGQETEAEHTGDDSSGSATGLSCRSALMDSLFNSLDVAQ